MLERRPQAAMARQQGRQRSLQRRRIEPARKPQHQLHGVDVGSLRIIKRMEQKPLLQRRQRQDVLDLRVLALQPLDLGLRQPQQRQVARTASAGAGRLRMAHQRLQRHKPALRQIADLRLRHQRRRKRPVRRQPRTFPAIERERIDLHAMRQRQRAIDPAAERRRLGSRRPVPARRQPQTDRDS